MKNEPKKIEVGTVLYTVQRRSFDDATPVVGEVIVTKATSKMLRFDRTHASGYAGACKRDAVGIQGFFLSPEAAVDDALRRAYASVAKARERLDRVRQYASRVGQLHDAFLEASPES